MQKITKILISLLFLLASEAKTIDISGLDKGEVLVALFRAAKLIPVFTVLFSPSDQLSLEQAKLELARARNSFFSTLHGRSMQVDLSGKAFSPLCFDVENGKGAAARAIADLRAAKK